MDVCVGKSKALKRDVPTAYLTCNGSPPVGDKPSLMTFDEVNTLYHEMGHGLQHMLTKVEDGDAAGINGVEWDAVELPSQFMENWLLDRPTLYGFAKHYETGEPLPDEFYDKLKGSKTFHAGLAMTRQLAFGMLDVELHKNAQLEEPVFDVQRRIFGSTWPSRRATTTASCAPSRTSSPAATRAATTRTSGPRCCRRTPSAPSRRPASRTRPRSASSASGSATRSSRAAAARRPRRCSRRSAGASRRPRR